MPDEPSLPGLACGVDPARRPALERLRAAWWVRLRPADAAEEHAVDAIVAQQWRAARLDALEERVLVALIEDRDLGKLPPLTTLLRCRARLQKERAQIEAELERLRATRPEIAAADAPAEEPEAPASEESRPPETAATPPAPSTETEPAGAVASEAPPVQRKSDERPPLGAFYAEVVERALASAEMLWSIGTVEGELDDPAAAAWLSEEERRALSRRRAAMG
ncbi:MAG: hypothetical protein KatS3mg117_0098 [Geminicoccaceae bacterium]|nr:MAG: hypothetical protein KatS3mg117_0098 [Geminicoccaceae bacterium]